MSTLLGRLQQSRGFSLVVGCGMIGALLLAYSGGVSGQEPVGGAANDTTVSQADELLVFENSCTPTTFRPDEWTLIECVNRFTSQVDVALSDVGTSITGCSGVVPNFVFILSQRDSEFVPIETAPSGSFGGFELPAWNTVDTRTLLLLRTVEGTLSCDLAVRANGAVVDTRELTFVAARGAAHPLTDLQMTRELVDVSPDGQLVTFEVTVTNQSSTSISALTLTERRDWALLKAAEPSPLAQLPDVELVMWDLSSFGREALEPGESLALRESYGPDLPFNCAQAGGGLVAEAIFDGEQRFYGLRLEPRLVGNCPPIRPPSAETPTPSPSNGGGPVVLPGTGEEPGEARGDATAAAAALALAVTILTAVAVMTRRKAEK
jgi:hypothetical protein